MLAAVLCLLALSRCLGHTVELRYNTGMQEPFHSKPAKDEVSIRVVSHNIRYATSSPFKGEEPWSIRKQYIINGLRFNTAHCPEAFICCQEVLNEQLLDILEGLPDEDSWAYIGVGREDGKKAGEYSPIFYRTAVWELLNFTSVWLSLTPDVPSKSWDAASTRILTIGHFRHKQSEQELIAMNTHLDDQGSESRLKAAEIIEERAAAFSYRENAPDLPLFLTGDFNSEPGQEAYAYTTTNGSFSDTFLDENSQGHYGNMNTFTGFEDVDEKKRIDFIFARYRDGERSRTPWKVDQHACLSNRFDDGVFSSDHRPVVADLVLKG